MNSADQLHARVATARRALRDAVNNAEPDPHDWEDRLETGFHSGLCEAYEIMAELLRWPPLDDESTDSDSEAAPGVDGK